MAEPSRIDLEANPVEGALHVVTEFGHAESCSKAPGIAKSNPVQHCGPVQHRATESCLNKALATSSLAEGELAPGEAADSPQVELTSGQRLELFESCLEEHEQSVFAYAYRLSGCTAAAEDIAQEVFIRAFRNIHQLRELQAARSWLLTITRNEFARWCGKFAAKPRLDESEIAEQAIEPEAERLDRQEWIQQALNELPEDFRTALCMYYFEQLSYADIASQLQIPMGTVMSRLSRGKQQLRQALEVLSEPSFRKDANHGGE